MKNTVLILSIMLLGYFHNINAQEKILTFEEINNTDFMKSIKNNELIKGFVISTGDTVKLNDIVKIGKPSQDRPTYSAYIKRKVNYYMTIFLGKPKLLSIINLNYLPEGFENKKVLIEEIIAKKIGRKNPALILIKLKFINENFSKIKSVAFLQAFNNNELLVINGKLTKDMALLKLKEAKEKLDLELITREEYNKIKAKLAPIIMKN